MLHEEISEFISFLFYVILSENVTFYVNIIFAIDCMERRKNERKRKNGI